MLTVTSYCLIWELLINHISKYSKQYKYHIPDGFCSCHSCLHSGNMQIPVGIPPEWNSHLAGSCAKSDSARIPGIHNSGRNQWGTVKSSIIVVIGLEMLPLGLNRHGCTVILAIRLYT